MTTRGNPDRGTPVPTTKPSGLPGEAARRLHPAARDCSLPRSSCRGRCARDHAGYTQDSCTAVPPGCCTLGGPRDRQRKCRTCAATTAQHCHPHRDGSAQQDGSLQRPDHGRHFQLSRSRPSAPWRELGLLQVVRGGAFHQTGLVERPLRAEQGDFGTPCSRRWCARARSARTGLPSSLPTRACSFLVALRCRRGAIHTRRGRVRRLHCVFR